jgi:hypothetical protein
MHPHRTQSARAAQAWLSKALLRKNNATGPRPSLRRSRCRGAFRRWLIGRRRLPKTARFTVGLKTKFPAHPREPVTSSPRASRETRMAGFIGANRSSKLSCEISSRRNAVSFSPVGRLALAIAAVCRNPIPTRISSAAGEDLQVLIQIWELRSAFAVIPFSAAVEYPAKSRVCTFLDARLFPLGFGAAFSLAASRNLRKRRAGAISSGPVCKNRGRLLRPMRADMRRPPPLGSDPNAGVPL